MVYTVIWLKDADGLANSLDRDQTIPSGVVWSGSAPFAQTCQFENFEITVIKDAHADLSLRWAHKSFCWFCHVAAHFKICLFQLMCSFGSEDLGFVLENIRELSSFVDFNSKFDSGPIDMR